MISFTQDIATMVIYDIEDDSFVTFTSPMGSANLKGCHEVQNIGAVETYQRRYLYVTALAIVEHDALDATTGSVEKKPEVVAVKKPEGVQQDDQNLEVLVDVLVEFGDTCESLSELSGLWKKNQKDIDQIKATNKELYQVLQSKFAEYKAKFKEE